MLHDFLESNQKEILAMTEKKSALLAGFRPSSIQLEKGLPLFYDQLKTVLIAEESSKFSDNDHEAMAKAASDNDEPAMARASGRPDEAELATSAGIHGKELMRLGYTLSHVVHAYGSMCQSITELATKKNINISPDEFHDLNRCLDIAIAGAVTEFQFNRNSQDTKSEIKHLGFLAHELRNAFMSVNVSLQMIKKGTVGFSGNTGRILDVSLKRMQYLIDQSLTEVRMKVDPQIHREPIVLLHLVDQIMLTSAYNVKDKNINFSLEIPPDLILDLDSQLLHSALSNLIQNALKFTRQNGKIIIRAKKSSDQVQIEVEDECGGLTDSGVDLFKAFEQQNTDRSGLGLGLTIAKRAVELNHGNISVRDLPGKGCIFTIQIPLCEEAKPLFN